MARTDDEADRAARRFAEQGGKGFAQRSVPGAGAAVAAGTVRRAMKRIGAVPPPNESAPPPNESVPPPKEPESPKDRAKTAAAQEAHRAAQALLGVVGAAGADETALDERLAGLSAEQLRRLGDLVSIVQQKRAGSGPSRVLESVERRLLDHGVKLEVKAGNVTINVGTQTAPGGVIAEPAPAQAPAAVSNGGGLLWARRLARVRDFIEGR